MSEGELVSARMALLEFFRKHITPIVAAISFFPVYLWSFRYPFPAEVRLILDGSVHQAAILELVTTTAACAIIARFSAYQIAPVIKQICSTRTEDLFFPKLARLHSLLLRFELVLANEVLLTIEFFALTITFYFLGFHGIIFVTFYGLALFSAFGQWERNRLINEGRREVVFQSPYTVAKSSFREMNFTAVFQRHINFFSICFLTLALVLGGTRTVSLLQNDNTALQIGTEQKLVKLLASTGSGLIFVSADDASFLKLMLGWPVDFFLLLPNGSILCFGEGNDDCSMP